MFDFQVLNRIGQTCVNLRELDVSSCPVSDSGIMSLCMSLGQPDKCSKLVKLNVLSTAVTAKGAEIVISNCKQLRVFQFCDVCEVLYRLFGSQLKDKEFKQSEQVAILPLQYMSIQQMKASLAPVAASIEVSCRICPYITEVYFVRGVTNQGLMYLSTLEHLKSVTLANSEEEAITFEEGIVPLLQIRGATIEELSLNDINKIDIACIGAFCPNIRTLSCLVAGYGVSEFLISSQPEVLNKGSRMFAKLIDLKLLLHCPQNSFPAACLKLLFQNSHNLETLHLNNIDALTDDVMFEIFEANSLRSTNSVRLETCQHITAAPVWFLLEADNELAYLNLSHCLEITRQDVEDFERYCKSKRYNVKIVWS